MKTLCLLFLSLTALNVFSQTEENSIVYVTYVKGEVRKPNDSVINSGDTIKLKSVKGLKYITPGSMVAYYHPLIGNLRLSSVAMAGHGNHESFGEFLAHLFKIKEKRIPLASRGDCVCASPASCFYVDTSVNDKILILDSLSFLPDPSLYEVEKAYYFLQYNKETKRLRINNGYVQITPQDLLFKDYIMNEGETPTLKLCLYKLNFGISSAHFISNVKFKVSSTNEIKEYYRTLQKALNPDDSKEFYDIFCSGVYAIWGKPNECQINRLVNTITE
jgi:hypothetical protein